jgi:hypothetical protein
MFEEEQRSQSACYQERERVCLRDEVKMEEV